MLAILQGINVRKLKSTTRIAFALAMWSATVLLGLRMLGVLSDNVEQVLESRVSRCESIAYACAEFSGSNQYQSVSRLLSYHVDHSPEILAAKCTINDNTIFKSNGHNDALWNSKDGRGALTCIRIPIEISAPDVTERQSGVVDLTFTAPVESGILGIIGRQSILVTSIASCLNLIGFMFITRRCFRDLDPSKVVPERVRSAFDTMAEMVIVLDEQNRIALTNKSFIDNLKLGRVAGKHVDSLPWRLPTDEEKFSDVMRRIMVDESDTTIVSLEMSDGTTRTLKPNVSLIEDEQGVCRGYLISMDDITILEERTTALQNTLSELRTSQIEIEQQNEKLKYMATRDPMTGCYNRRAFFEKLSEVWKTTTRYRHPLGCVMVDVDHFKSINDNYGHGTGDEVLTGVAKALMQTARETDFVCRYGGEEFCILLPHVEIEGTEVASERFRKAIAALEFDQLSVTASVGCSGFELGPDSGAAMIDQADQALYAAKENGRNRVVRFDQIADVESQVGGDDAAPCRGDHCLDSTESPANVKSAIGGAVADSVVRSNRSIDHVFSSVDS